MYYKFLDTTDIDKVLVDQTLVISSFEYFRRIEVERPGIGDGFEGASQLIFNDDFLMTERLQNLEKINNALSRFANVTEGGIVKINKRVTITRILNDMHIYSIACGDLQRLTTEFCVRSTRPYNACLRIKDLAQLQMTIYNEGRVRNMDRRVRDIFFMCQVEDVRYEDRVSDPVTEAIKTPSPFIKACKFSNQSETRMVFDPIRTATKLNIGDRLIIEVPGLADYFEEMFRNSRF